MRTVRRLRLRYLLFTSTPDVLSARLIIALSNLVTPNKMYCFRPLNFTLGNASQYILVEVVGFAPTSKTTFTSLHTTILYGASDVTFSTLTGLYAAINAIYSSAVASSAQWYVTLAVVTLLSGQVIFP